MRLLVLGGSFNPIHIGHLMLAEEVCAEFGYDRVLLVPSFLPPHKALADDPGSGARLDMARAATADDGRYIVDACEIERGGLSYTLDTLRHVLETYPLQGRPGLVIGDDLAAGFGSWRDPDGICGIADLIVARRGGVPSEMRYPHRLARNMILPVSSTDIRARISSGKPWRRLVPGAAACYIEDHELYGVR